MTKTRQSYSKGETVTYRLRTGVTGTLTIRRVTTSDWPIANQTTLYGTYADGTTGTVDARYIIR